MGCAEGPFWVRRGEEGGGGWAGVWSLQDTVALASGGGEEGRFKRMTMRSSSKGSGRGQVAASQGPARTF